MMERGNIHNRDRFLQDLSKKLGREEPIQMVQKPKWDQKPQEKVLNDCTQEELVQVLKQQCKNVLTDVKETSVHTLVDTLNEVISDYGAKSIVIWDDIRFKEYHLEDWGNKDLTDHGIDFHVWDPDSSEKNVTFAEKADVGITFSDMTLAESATVVLMSSQEKGRSVSLLPKTYIAIIPKSTIVPRLTQFAKKIHKYSKEKLIPSCINFISGPSNSGDIEMNLVVGVHGPIKVTYIIVEDK